MFSSTYFIKQHQHNWKRNPFSGLFMVLCFIFTIIACDRDPIVPSNQNNATRPTAIINTIGLTIRYPANKTILDGTLSSDPIGIKSYKWLLVSGQANGNPTIENPDSAITTFSGLNPGSYRVQLTIINQKNIAASTYQTVWVQNNEMPVAFAGDHQVILPNDPIQLSGRGTYDDDMNTVKFFWKQVAGPTHVKIDEPNSMTTSVSQLILGTYSFELRVVDNVNQTSTDTVHIAVRNPGEIENASSDQG